MMLSPRDALYYSIAAGTWPDISPFTTVPLNEALFDDGMHWWQFDLLVEVAQLYRAGYRRVLLQLATGGGKTVIALSALLSARRQGLQAQFLVHRKELLEQTSKRFTSSALDHSFVAADFPFDPAAGLMLSGVQTLIRRLAKVLPPNLVIVDECHHGTSTTYAEILEQWPDAFILGLTATPQRLDGRGLDEQFDAMVLGPAPRWLIDNGYLSDYDLYAPDIPDMTGVPSTGGDYQRDAAAAVVNKPRLVGRMVEHYLELGRGQQGIVFAQNREHSRSIADAFTAHGIPALHVDGDTPKEERKRFDAAFRAEDIRIAVNVALLGEGYDVPNIGYLGVGARTKSLINWLQWCGRPLRFVAGKRAVICDHGGNALPTHLGGSGLGLPDDDRDWSLRGRDAKAPKPKDWTSITQCMDCFRVYPSAAPCCPGCNSDRQAMPRAIKQEDGKLTKLEREALKRATAAERKMEERLCTTFQQFISLGEARNYTYPVEWARHQCNLRRIPTTRVTMREVEWDG
jgi:superfamily II DNA or RNA helicase